MKSFLGGLAWFFFIIAMCALAVGLAGPFVVVPIGVTLIALCLLFGLASAGGVSPPRSPSSRCDGEGLAANRSTGVPASPQNRRSSGATGTLPSGGATPDFRGRHR